ncbi:MAG TPA: 3-dehydroquinate synthase [Clostridium sp.]|nr:3-dehydroquinate synthase [Clostridium sp.]
MNLNIELRRVIDDSYDIEIGENLFNKLIEDLKNNLVNDISKYCIITDDIVAQLYGNRLLELVTSNGFQADIITFPAGEKSKTRQTKEQIEDYMLAKAYGRDSCIIALGGGVVTDLSGFIAATFRRGIPFINYATSLLGAADASVGGKTAVDTELATNQIGVIYQPKKVYIDVACWSTLPIDQIRSGLSETIKHACLADKDFFEYLEANINKIVNAKDELILDREVCEHIAIKNCEIKYQVVKSDEKELSLREILNLGHTVGRAIETLSQYKLLHGQAVSIGMAFQVKLANKLGYLSEHDMNRVIALYKKAGLPTELPSYIIPEELVNKLYTDKKVRKGKIRFVLQSGIGEIQKFDKGKYSTDVDEKIIYEVIGLM